MKRKFVFASMIMATLTLGACSSSVETEGELPEDLSEMLNETLDSVEDTANDAADDVEDTATDAADDAEQTIKEVAIEKGEDLVEENEDEIKDAIKGL